MSITSDMVILLRSQKARRPRATRRLQRSADELRAAMFKTARAEKGEAGRAPNQGPRPAGLLRSSHARNRPRTGAVSSDGRICPGRCPPVTKRATWRLGAALRACAIFLTARPSVQCSAPRSLTAEVVTIRLGDAKRRARAGHSLDRSRRLEMTAPRIVTATSGDQVP